MTFHRFLFQNLPLTLLAAGLSLTAHTVAAQKYRTAAGLRLGKDNFGITVQQLILPKTTLEGIGIARNREVSATLLAEHHFGVLGRSLNYYAGAGAHVGNNKDTGTFGGFDGIVGLEYKVAFFPIVLSLDAKPSVEIHNDDWFRFPTAFSVRYVLIKERKTGLFNGIFGRDKNRKKSKAKEKSGSRRGLFD